MDAIYKCSQFSKSIAMATITSLPSNNHHISVYANRKFIEKLNTIRNKSNSNQKKSRTRDTDASTPLAE